MAKFNKARFEKYLNKSLEAWIQLMQEDPGYPALTKREIRKWATRLVKVVHDHETGQYTCTICGGRNTGISGPAISTVDIQRHLLIQTVGLVYPGTCEDCEKQARLDRGILNWITHLTGETYEP